MSIYKVANYYQVKLAQTSQSAFGKVSKLLSLAKVLESQIGASKSSFTGGLSDMPSPPVAPTFSESPSGGARPLSQQKPLTELQQSVSVNKKYPTDELKTFSKDFESKQKPQLLTAIKSIRYLYSTIYNKGIDASNFKSILNSIKSSLLNAAMAGYASPLTGDMIKLAQDIVPVDMPAQKPEIFSKNITGPAGSLMENVSNIFGDIYKNPENMSSKKKP